MTPEMIDQEEWATIKHWWNRYGKAITWAIIIGLAVGTTWRYWRQYQVHRATQASVLYDQLNIAEMQQQAKQTKEIATQLIQQYPKTPYATLAAFWQAQQLITEQRYSAALQQLEWARQHTRVSRFQQIARIRAARVLLFQQQFQAALRLLETVDDVTYQPWIDEIKGDIYAATQRPEAAMQAYRSAALAFSELSLPNPLLQMKLARSTNVPSINKS